MKQVFSLIVLTVIMLIVVNLYSAGSVEESSPSSQQGHLRFEVIEKGPFLDDPHEYYQIIVDHETGYKYLYIWAGMGNGGPAITKL